MTKKSNRLEKIAERLGIVPEDLSPLIQEASARQYFRITRPYGRTEVLMLLPEEGEKHEEIGGYENPTERPAFVSMGEFFLENHIPVPRIYRYDSELNFITLEDLGNLRLYDLITEEGLSERVKRIYRRCMDIILEIQPLCSRLKESHSAFYRCFSRDVLLNELLHFDEYGLKELGSPDKKEKDLLLEFYEELANRISNLPYALVHRDFQSKNIMIDQDGKVRILDFQDALLGPRVYDVVALLRDSYIELPGEFLEEMIRAAAEGLDTGFEKILEEFYLVTLQRKLKDAGRFVFIRDVKGNPSFMQYFKRTMGYVMDALSRFQEYREVFEILSGIVR